MNNLIWRNISLNRYFAIVTIASIITLCLLTACSTNTNEEKTITEDANSHSNEKKIITNHVHINFNENISFSGDSVLPDGTYLQTQLYADDEIAIWWPVNKYTQVWQGEWEITVPLYGLSENTTKLYINSESLFMLKIWEKDNPSVITIFSFDLIGPPAVSDAGVIPTPYFPVRRNPGFTQMEARIEGRLILYESCLRLKPVFGKSYMIIWP